MTAPANSTVNPPLGSQSKGRLRIAVDIGGTFTDLAAFDEAAGRLMFGKSLSTHGSLVDGIQNAINAGVDSIEHASLADEASVPEGAVYRTVFQAADNALAIMNHPR